jgi:hypothetical protein
VPKRDEIIGSGENYATRGFINCTNSPYYCNDQVEEDEMDRACSTNLRGFYTEFL